MKLTTILSLLGAALAAPTALHRRQSDQGLAEVETLTNLRGTIKTVPIAFGSPVALCSIRTKDLDAILATQAGGLEFVPDFCKSVKAYGKKPVPVDACTRGFSHMTRDAWARRMMMAELENVVSMRSFDAFCKNKAQCKDGHKYHSGHCRKIL